MRKEKKMTVEKAAVMTIAFIRVKAALGAPKDKTVNLLAEHLGELLDHNVRLALESEYDRVAALSPEKKREILFDTLEKTEKFIPKRTKVLAEEAAEMDGEEAENGQS